MLLPKVPTKNMTYKAATRCLVLSATFCVLPINLNAQSSMNTPLQTPAIERLPKQTINVVKPDLLKFQPRIQMAILLDTSGSMDGLIDQARNQLWQVVNEFSTAKRNGKTPILEVALFEYGNDGNPKSQGFVRQLTGFTRELDKVSEGLFSLTTNGGSEYCGYAIKTAVENLQWSHSANDIKTIFIAGNEPFTQGPVQYQQAIQVARQQGISVNTIFAGDYQQGVNSGWSSGANLAGGDYMSIDANQRTAHIEAPQDRRIAELNSKLNETYIPYGRQGAASAERQVEQDKLSSNISAGLLAKRAKSKSSTLYNNSSWDLVDAVNDGKVEDAELAQMEEAILPKEMRKLTPKARQDYVLQKAQERKNIKQEIASLSEKRDAFVAKKKRENIAAMPSMSDALTEAIKKQATKKNFKFEKESQE